MSRDRKTKPAFPVAAGNQVYSSGMTLRQYFAGQALAGIDIDGLVPSYIAKSCYAIADAMIAESEKPNE